MDTGKLLKIIDDIQEEEQNSKIQTLLNNIVSYFNGNDPTSLNTEKEKVRVAVTNSRISQYALSDFKALERLKVADLFGPGLYQRLQDALGSQAHEVPTLLQQLVAERNAALSSLDTLETNLLGFHFKSRALNDHNYEIGFVLPEGYLELEKTEGALKDFRLLLAELASATHDQQALKIEYVSSGSVELFVHAHAALAQHFGVVLEYALNIYEAIEIGQKLTRKIKSFSEKHKHEIEKQIKEEKEEKASQLIDEMITALGITDPETGTRVKGLFKKFLRHIERGVSAEVHTPEIAAPVEPQADATKDEKASYTEAKKLYSQKLQIDARNQKVFVLQQNNFYGMDTKFLEVSGKSDASETGDE